MNKKFFLQFILIAGMVLLSACDTFDTFTIKQATPVVYEAVADSSSNAIIADGEIIPANDILIIAQVSGEIEEVFLAEGQSVQAGQAIFRLKTPHQLMAELEAARMSQLTAQQSIDNLNLYGPLQKKEAYQKVLDTSTAYDSAQAAWDEFDKDQYDDDLEQIKEDVIDAKQELEDAKDDLKEYQDLDADNPQRKNRQDDVDEAQLTLNELEREQTALEQSYEQLQLNIELADAQKETARQEYAKFNQDDVQEDQLSLAEEQLAAANEKLDSIQASIDDLTITSPITGDLVNLDVQVGDTIFAGQQVAVLADFSTWYVQTTDLNELEIVGIQVDDPVTLELDAFPGQILRGNVIEISDYPSLKYNDVVYPVKIKIQENDLHLRWKMSVVVTFDR